MGKLLLSKEKRNIVDIFNPDKSEYQLPENLPVDFIINNNLCFSLYNKVCSELASKFNSEELEPICRKAKSMEFSINELHIISRAFEEKGINHLHLFKAIESQCDSTDVDAVVEDKQIEKARKVLESLGYFVPHSLYGKDFFVKSKGSDEICYIDLITEKEFKRYHYIFNEGKIRILSNIRKINGLHVPSIEDDLVISILRTIEKNQIPICTVLHISYLLENCRDINYIKNCIKRGWYTPLLHSIYVVNALYKNLFGKEIQSPLISIAKKIHEKSKILGFLAKKETKKIKFPFDSKIFFSFSHTYELLNAKGRIKKFKAIVKIISPSVANRILQLISFSHKKSTLITLSGIDGTGKSTNATKLVRRFNKMNIPSQYALGLWSPKVSYPLMGALYLLKGWRRKDYHKSKILRKVWNYVVILDYLYIYLFRIKRHLFAGKTVFADKYVYDLIATLMRDGLYNERATKIMLKLIPQPDLVFIFDIPEEVSDLRKDDTQEWLDRLRIDQDLREYLKIMRENYKKIAKSLDIPIIDATKEWNELHEAIFNKVLVTYKNRGVNKKMKSIGN